MQLLKWISSFYYTKEQKYGFQAGLSFLFCSVSISAVFAGLSCQGPWEGIIDATVKINQLFLLNYKEQKYSFQTGLFFSSAAVPITNQVV